MLYPVSSTSLTLNLRVLIQLMLELSSSSLRLPIPSVRLRFLPDLAPMGERSPRRHPRPTFYRDEPNLFVTNPPISLHPSKPFPNERFRFPPLLLRHRSPTLNYATEEQSCRWRWSWYRIMKTTSSIVYH
ncbi:hypothetical protein Hanom_Chr11g01033271 [Helianthus anomalus]